MRKNIGKLHPKNWFRTAKEESLTPPSSARLFFIELLKLTLLAVVTIFLVRYFLFKPFYVRGASMEPNFFDKEYLIIDELTYHFQTPQRGDIVVLRSPLNKSEYFLKRVIGLPGETIKIRDGRVLIFNEANPEGLVLKEDYIAKGVQTLPDVTTELGPGKYFVMGDNRFSSLDSRNLGPIDESSLVGRVLVRGLPINRAQFFSHPAY